MNGVDFSVGRGYYIYDNEDESPRCSSTGDIILRGEIFDDVLARWENVGEFFSLLWKSNVL